MTKSTGWRRRADVLESPRPLVRGVMAVVLLTGLLGACGGGEEFSAADCMDAGAVARAIEDGPSDGPIEVVNPQAVATGDSDFGVVVAGVVDGRVGVWASGGLNNEGPLQGLDAVAWEVTVWGTAMSPGSPMDERRIELAESDEAAQARECATMGQ